MESSLRNVDGVVLADATGEKDGDAFTFILEAAKGVDLRKPLFYMLAKNNWPLVGMEPLGMDLEDVFVKIMDEDEKRRAPAKRRGR